MNAVREALKELVGLFVDDGSLALAIIGLVAAATLMAAAAAPKALIGCVLLGGCLAVLAENVLRARRSATRKRGT
jgi:hypothetical protein